MLGSSGLELVATRFEDPAVQALVVSVQAEYVVRYGSPDETPLPTGVFDAPGGAFFLGLEDGTPVAMGGWRLRTDVQPWGLSPAAEIKRMYVAGTSRRRGHARAVLAHLEQTAHSAGARVMVLETGVGQPEAIRLYTAAGYLAVPAFGHYAGWPSARHLGKQL